MAYRIFHAALAAAATSLRHDPQALARMVEASREALRAMFEGAGNPGIHAALGHVEAARRGQAPHVRVPPAILHDVIALFPGELQRDPASRHLQLDHHDVPWEESELVRDGLDRPWSERGLLARARALLRRRRPGAPAVQ